ncbi:metal ABC transporter solute-binding protein, Zn/Mn family [Hydrogenimonas urashimensis]|uniref:metal ABC transporter solute-binding protein, Zn/Mn family n=1 Tax=Hydrogenimonas urashimensis TaxID=2740515 RepID=UPI001F28DD86|nr:zinc ABC transporter substrate-binding protein [Hydrogenimonas urashimensis]
MRRKAGYKGWLIALLWLMPMVLAAEIRVAVSIVPQKYFVEKIAGGLADVTVMVAPGASPATYEPKPSQMKKIARTEIYFAIGVPFEKAWLPRFKAQNPKMEVVDTTRGIEKVPMVSHHHAHGKQEAESGKQKSLDPHVWLAPPLVKIQARNIAAALEKKDPRHRDIYKKNLDAFEAEIDILDRRLKKRLAPCKGSAMMVFHPSWGYFARTYGLKQIPIEIEGKEPRSKELVHLIHEAKEEGVRALFVQPQFSKRTARVIAESIGAKLVEADPLAYAWADNLLKVAQKVCKVSK